MSQINTPQPGSTPLAPDVLNQLQALLQAQNARPAGMMAAPLPAFGQMPQAMPQATAVHIPIKIQVGQGNVKVMLTFGPEYASPDALMNLLNALGNAGIPIDVYVPKQQYGGGYNGGGGGYGNRGGYGGGGGFNGGGNRWGGR